MGEANFNEDYSLCLEGDELMNLGEGVEHTL